MNGVFEAEKVEDCADELLAAFELQVSDQRKAVPGGIDRTAFKVGIGNCEQAALFKIGQDNPPASAQIRDGARGKAGNPESSVRSHPGQMRVGALRSGRGGCD